MTLPVLEVLSKSRYAYAADVAAELAPSLVTRIVLWLASLTLPSGNHSTAPLSVGSLKSSHRPPGPRTCCSRCSRAAFASSARTTS